MSNDSIQRLLGSLPKSPGVYRFKNEEGQLLYVGKAKNLKNRVRSYFVKEKARSVRTQKLISQIADIEWTEVESDWEALVLENQFIKEFQPKYNVISKDDKNFVYIKITKDEAFPRIDIVRKVLKDGARYFGPKTSAGQVKKTLTLLQKLFKFRSCDLDMEWREGEVKVTRKTIAYPCLDFHIKRCDAPCISKITPEEYQKNMDQVEAFLEGDTEQIEQNLKEQMAQAVANKAFEKAAQVRDKLLAIEGLARHQIVASPELSDMDVFAFVIENEKAYFNLFLFRHGKLISQENFVTVAQGYEAGDEELAPELLEAFLQDYYENTQSFPDGILLPISLEEDSFFPSWIKNKANKKVDVRLPQRGQKHELLELSRKNAVSFMKQQVLKFLRRDLQEVEGMEELQRILELKKLPKRMECFDISHLAGNQTVASMVVFENGKQKNADYRKFHLRSLVSGEIDDFKSMREVLERRLSHLKKLPNGFKIKKGTKKDPPNSFSLMQEEKLVAFTEWELSSDKKLSLKTLNWAEGFSFDYYLLRGLLLAVQASFKVKRVYCPKELGLPQELLDRLSFKLIKQGDAFVMDFADFYDASFSKMPDLIVIDGGKGQLGKAVEAAKFWGLEVPMISLAKREEEVFLPDRSLPVLLSQDSPSLQMLMRLRDEAHRFAITFQRGTRKQNLNASILDEIPGLGAKTKHKLLKEFGSPAQVKTASLEDIQKIVGPILAEKIHAYLKQKTLGENRD